MTVVPNKVFVDGIRLPGVIQFELNEIDGVRTANITIKFEEGEINPYDGTVRFITKEALPEFARIDQ